MIICLTGFPGSGKSTAGDILEKMGFKIVDSSVIKEEMKKGGIAINPISMEEFVNKMKREKGEAVFARITASRTKALMGQNVAIIGLRSMAELQEVQNAIRINIPIVVITSSEELRFSRLSGRKEMAIKSKDDFINRDKSNINMGILELMGKADYIVSNAGSENELEASILELLKKIGDGG